MTTPLIRLSFCECGFPCLRDEIPLGYEYEVDFHNVIDAQYVCGGCGSVSQIRAVAVAPVGYLPLNLFELPNEQAHSV